MWTWVFFGGASIILFTLLVPLNSFMYSVLPTQKVEKKIHSLRKKLIPSDLAISVLGFYRYVSSVKNGICTMLLTAQL